jgi:hypothetical protein
MEVDMHRKYVCLLAFVFVHFLAGSSQAEEAKAVNQPPENRSPHAEPKPSTQYANSSPAPLDIYQIRANLPGSLTEKFEYLRRHRKITLDGIAEASSQKTNLGAQLSLVQTSKKALEQEEEERPTPTMSKERLREELTRIKQGVDEAEKKLKTAKERKPSASQDEVDRLEEKLVDARQYSTRLQDNYDNYDQRRKDEDKRKQDVQKKITEATEELSRISQQNEKVAQDQLLYQRLLGEIDDMVNQLFIASDATNSFKYKMSLAFSILVGVVIVGFFIIAWSNEEIKKTIFSNESGIQFITMFAIVIAVILFGIIGVLESKELSALLGGLSGYILGKSRAAAPS